MEDIIEKVLKIEDMAQAVVAEAKEEQKNMDKSIDEAAKALEESLRAELEEERARVQAEEDERARRRLEDVKAANKAKDTQLDEIFAARKDGWIEEIFDNIIGK